MAISVGDICCFFLVAPSGLFLRQRAQMCLNFSGLLGLDLSQVGLQVGAECCGALGGRSPLQFGHQKASQTEASMSPCQTFLQEAMPVTRPPCL